MQKLEEAYKMYGKNYTKMRELIGTKSQAQVQCRVTTLAKMYRRNPKSVPKSLHRLVKFERKLLYIWSREEIVEFEEGLLKYGRDYEKLAEHTSKSIK